MVPAVTGFITSLDTDMCGRRLERDSRLTLDSTLLCVALDFLLCEGAFKLILVTVLLQVKS